MPLSSHSPQFISAQLPWAPLTMRINTIGDGNCFFHAIALACCKQYQEGDTLYRQHFIQQLRYQLSLTLTEGSPPKYNLLSRGQLSAMSKEMPEYSLANMQKELNSNLPVSNLYLELCSDVLSLDIYLIDLVKKDVYVIGDKELLWKNRQSIVIGYSPGHYELMGYVEREVFLRTVFPPHHIFITTIQNRH